MKTPGGAGETIVTPGDAKELITTATRSNMNGSSLHCILVTIGGVYHLWFWPVPFMAREGAIHSPPPPIYGFSTPSFFPSAPSFY